ncbi:MAG: hypothetical protein RIF32_01990 [Leptospirales bacterium]|jgi:ribulose-5-phosphate 4-epimerase/fuculose-1-phosphate aldolase
MKKKSNTIETQSDVARDANLEIVDEQQKADLLQGYRRLREKGLADSARLSISRRIPGRSAFIYLEWLPGEGGAKSALPGMKHVAVFDFGGGPLEGNLAHMRWTPSHLRLHARLYRLRPDLGAVVRYRPRCAGTLNQVETIMPGIFDEQVRQLGSRIEFLRETATGLDDASERLVRDGANVFLCSGDVLSLGYNQERVIFNCELIEKCARAFLLALATGHRVRRIPWLIRRIAGGRMRRDGRQAAAAYARGEFPEGISAY